MTVAYVDSSCLVAIALDEPSAPAVSSRLQSAPALVASNLVEAELRSALARERVDVDPGPILEKIRWIHPDRELSEELDRVLALGYLRGADAWHLANALWFAEDRTDLEFLTLDDRQRTVAEQLGLPAPGWSG